MLKWFLNDNYKMLVNTLLFLTLDLYLFTFDEPKSERFAESFSDDFFTTKANIKEIDYLYNPVKMMDVVMSVDQKQSTHVYTTPEKHENRITIASHEDIYDFHLSETTGCALAVLIKKFDVDNYIVPLTAFASQEYLVENGFRFDLSYMVQELDNTEQLKNKLSKFRKIILI